MVLSFPVVTFGVIAIVAGGATVLMPMIKASLMRSRKRRRSKNRKSRKSQSHMSRQRIDLTATPQTDPPPASQADTG